MTSQTFFDRAATLGGLFAFILVVSYLLSACAADAELSREQGRVCVASGRSWDSGWYSVCRPTPSPIR